MIIKNREDLLRVKCEDVKPDEVGPLIDQLEKELELSEKLGNPGIGLAAPQIGIAKKIAIVRIRTSIFATTKINLVNARIQNGYDKFLFQDEGCLSFPGRVEHTMRFNEIHVVDNLVYPKKAIITGLPAIVCQHELDHLSGVLLPDIAVRKLPKKQNPNDKCLCLSGRKYKKCCGKY